MPEFLGLFNEQGVEYYRLIGENEFDRYLAPFMAPRVLGLLLFESKEGIQSSYRNGVLYYWFNWLYSPKGVIYEERVIPFSGRMFKIRLRIRVEYSISGEQILSVRTYRNYYECVFLHYLSYRGLCFGDEVNSKIYEERTPITMVKEKIRFIRECLKNFDYVQPSSWISSSDEIFQPLKREVKREVEMLLSPASNSSGEAKEALWKEALWYAD